MKHKYVGMISQWLMVVYALGILGKAQAQTTQAPTLQWQRVIDGSDGTQASGIRAVKASNGGYGVLSGKNLVRLSITGDVIWNKPVPGSYADSSSNRLVVREVIALVPTKDNGFAVLAKDELKRYYVTKIDSAGNGSWTKTVARPSADSTVRVTGDALAVAPDGSLLVVGSYHDVLAYLTMTKLNAEGSIAGEWRVKFSDSPQSATPIIRQVLTLSNQGFLLVGSTTGATTPDSKGLAIQLDAQYNLIWQQTYPTLYSLADVIANPRAEGAYTAIGSSAGTSVQLINVAPKGTGDGDPIVSVPVVSSAVSLVNDRTGNVTLLGTAASNNGDFFLTNATLPATFHWTKTVGGSGVDVPMALLATDDGGYLVLGTTTSTDGDVMGKSTSTVATWIIKLGNSSQVTTLRLLAPTNDCQTGFIRFQTSGGDGTPITYTAPGVTRVSITDNFGMVEQGLRKDPKVITIQATQSGQTVSYAFDLGAYCPNSETATADTLRMSPPTYNCQTGAITFHTSGGDGTPVEYAAAGVTDWTTNPDQFVDSELRTAYDAQPLKLMARQSGRVVMYVLDIKAECGRARIGAGEPKTSTDLRVTLLGNPVREAATVEIVGVEGQTLLLNLIDAHGRLIEHRMVEQAGETERQTFDLRHQAAGPLLLHTTTAGQTRIIKVIKQ